MILLVLLVSGFFTNVGAQTDLAPITPENINQLELGYALPGGSICELSPDGASVNTYDGLYDVMTGQPVFQMEQPPYRVTFSPDGTMMIFKSEVYDTHTRQVVFSPPIEGEWGLIFSPDSSLLAVGGYGVVETDTWSKRIDIPDGAPIKFSPDSKWLAVWSTVYDIETGEAVFSFTPGTSIEFSPDSTLMATSIAVFDTGTWEKRFDIAGNARFSPDSRLIVIFRDGIRETATGQYVAHHSDAIDYGDFAFSPDGTMIAFGREGEMVQSTSNWEVLYTFDGFPPTFSPNGTLLATPSGIYDAQNGELLFDFNLSGSQLSFNLDNTILATGQHDFCALYAIEGMSWPYRSALVYLDSGGIYPVYATTPDGKWLRISEIFWAAADDIDILSLPEGIPVEDPASE